MSGVTLVRHTETDMAGRFCGHADPALNVRGVAQANELGEKLREQKIDRIYSSDLARARMTADAIASACGIEIAVRESLREIGFGEWEGLSWKEIEARDAQYAQRWLAEFPRLRAPGGEELEVFERRVLKEFDSIAGEAETRSIVVVSHAGVLRTILRERYGWRDEEAWKRTGMYGTVIVCEPAGVMP